MPLDFASAARLRCAVAAGGVMNQDKLRVIPKAVQFVSEFFAANKAGRGHLPRPSDACESRRFEGANDYIVARTSGSMA